MDDIIDVAVGFDQREAVAYHTFVQSVIENASIPVRFMPLDIKSLKTYNETHTDGSNEFIYARFLVPYLMNFKGWAIFMDCDMLCQDDIANLWNQRNEKYAIMSIKHKEFDVKGVQFHPESILTQQGMSLIRNWLIS